ncbi:tail protein X [Hydrogenimonas sp.]
MNQYRAIEGDRLDIIVFKAYGRIDAHIMDAVMEANPHLLDKTVLSVGDIVYLPEIKTVQSESTAKALW